ncbi:MAG: saccharopine dehydrogenase family protein [Saprospiraceae bacterium]
MAKVIIIGAGGVGRVTTVKCAQHPEVFSEILLASRTVSKCEDIAQDAMKRTGHQHITTAAIDAEDVPALTQLIKDFGAELLIHVALPYQDLTIMEACLNAGVHYLDTANYEPKDEAKFEYSHQWKLHDRFAKAGLLAVLGCGFDPGVTQVFTANAAKHHFDEMHYLDIVDANAGDHGKAFATNFNPEINIREITQKGKYWENGEWVETEPFEHKKVLNYPDVGPKDSYLLYHEELESLVKNFPTLKRARFWMTFGQEYLTHLRVIQNIGMAGIKPVMHKGVEIIPLEFLTSVLPNPDTLGDNYTGQTSIGCRIRGIKDGKDKTYYIWNNTSHAAAYEETGAQGVSFTTGVPAMTGAMMMLTGEWAGKGVFNVEEFNPDPFLAGIAKYGLKWHEEINGDIEFEA